MDRGRPSRHVGEVGDRQYSLSEAADTVRYVGSGQARAKVVINVA